MYTSVYIYNICSTNFAVDQKRKRSKPVCREQDPREPQYLQAFTKVRRGHERSVSIQIPPTTSFLLLFILLVVVKSTTIALKLHHWVCSMCARLCAWRSCTMSCFPCLSGHFHLLVSLYLYVLVCIICTEIIRGIVNCNLRSFNCPILDAHRRFERSFVDWIGVLCHTHQIIHGQFLKKT